MKRPSTASSTIITATTTIAAAIARSGRVSHASSAKIAIAASVRAIGGMRAAERVAGAPATAFARMSAPGMAPSGVMCVSKLSMWLDPITTIRPANNWSATARAGATRPSAPRSVCAGTWRTSGVRSPALSISVIGASDGSAPNRNQIDALMSGLRGHAGTGPDCEAHTSRSRQARKSSIEARACAPRSRIASATSCGEA